MTYQGLIHRYRQYLDLPAHTQTISLLEGNTPLIPIPGRNFDLYVMQTTGKHIRAVSAGWMVSAMMPRWSPWGHTLAYMAWPGSAWDSMHDAEIWVAEVSGSGYARRLTHNRVVDSNPAWSPDGSKIVFLRGPTAHNIVLPAQRSADEIYVMNADGTGVTRLTYNRVGEGGLAWQPVLWTASRER